MKRPRTKQTKSERREKRMRPRMPVSGRGAFTIQWLKKAHAACVDRTKLP